MSMDSRLRPEARAAETHFGILPRPVHVLPVEGSLYFGATFIPVEARFARGFLSLPDFKLGFRPRFPAVPVAEKPSSSGVIPNSEICFLMVLSTDEYSSLRCRSACFCRALIC